MGAEDRFEVEFPVGEAVVADRCFIGADHVRLHVVAGVETMVVLPGILRQLSYVEELAAPGGARDDRRDVYLVDGTLPAALEICRDLPKTAGRILTARDPTFAHRKLCAEIGVDALIAHPIEPRELAGWLEHYDGHREDGRAMVLIVDDDDLAAEVVASLLAVREIDSEIVTDPTRVFEALEARSFDLILMDLVMPKVGGIDLARMIRLDRRHLSVPIVFLSGGGDAETQLLARHFGGDDFISKRTERDLLVRLVQLRVERARVLRALIERDGLTGLVDHQRFVERIGLELSRSRRTGNEGSLVMIDIDHFKTVNDTWGHQAGDLVLRRLAAALVSRLRRTDVIGRYGGEEFGILMLDTPPDQAAPVVDAFRRHFGSLEMVFGDAAFRVTFSAGIAGMDRAADTAMLVAAADRALYRAKAGGRNRTVVDDPLDGERSASPPEPVGASSGLIAALPDDASTQTKEVTA